MVSRSVVRRVHLRLRYSPPFPQVCSVLACRLSYSRRANQSAFRSNGPRHVVHGPHDNYGCCHAHTYFHSRCASFHRRLLSERACSKEEEEGERELFSRFFFFLDAVDQYSSSTFKINCPLLYMLQDPKYNFVRR